MRALPCILLPLVAAAPSALACSDVGVCTVSDRTGTPLHVRQLPGGPILAILRNGQKLTVHEHMIHNGKRWAHVATYNPLEQLQGGWIYKSHIQCTREDGEEICTVGDPTGTPLNVRDSPNGRSLGTLANGDRIRIHEQKPHHGRLWARIQRFSEDNIIGFVFDDYLKCEEH